MSFTARAVFSGSSASSQPRGLPVSTAQNRHARVHTEPMIMIVAVPLFQHSPMFGHIDSSHTVDKRCWRTVWRTAENLAPAGRRARSHGGFWPPTKGAVPGLALMPFLIAVKPAGVRYLWPDSTMGMPLKRGLAGSSGRFMRKNNAGVYGKNRNSRTSRDMGERAGREPGARQAGASRKTSG